jgi:predicted PurR-regulated permease PerM
VHPLAVILGILAGSALLGIVGALVAIPVVAALQIVLREFFGANPEPPQDDAPPAEPPPPPPPAPAKPKPKPAPA